MKLAVIGDPVEHSRSPELHAAFLTEAGLSGTYERIRTKAGDGARAIDELRRLGYTGLNVTTPLKEEAFGRAERRDAVSLATGSVNTILFADSIEGYNTDGIGTLGVLADAGLRDLKGACVLVLGAGPTARSSIAALKGAGATVSVWTRKPEAMRDVAQRFAASAFAAGRGFDAVFAALPPEAVPPDPAVLAAVRDAAIFVDANYGDRATLAKAIGRTGFDGTKMLEHSARASFEIWRSAAPGRSLSI